MGYLIDAWNMSQKKFHMTLKQVVANAGDGTLENSGSIDELREFYTMIDLDTMGRLLDESINRDKRYKFDTRGFAFQDLVNEMGRRLGYEVENGLYRGRRNEVGFDGLWKSKDGYCIVMESKTSDDYSIQMETVTGYRDKLLIEEKIPKKKCSILIVYGRDDKGALRNTVKGSDEAKNIRLISANALFQLVKLTASAKSEITSKQIFSMLQPRDYFVLDNLVELVFPETDDDIPEVEYEDEPSEKDTIFKEEQEGPVEPSAKGKIPPLPEQALKCGKFVQTAMKNLANSGYEFSDEYMEKLCGAESMHDIVGMQRKLPFFKEYNPDEQQGNYINGRPRFYASPLRFGKHEVYLNSQIYETDREPFIAWYRSLK